MPRVGGWDVVTKGANDGTTGVCHDGTKEGQKSPRPLFAFFRHCHRNRAPIQELQYNIMGLAAHCSKTALVPLRQPTDSSQLQAFIVCSCIFRSFSQTCLSLLSSSTVICCTLCCSFEVAPCMFSRVFGKGAMGAAVANRAGLLKKCIPMGSQSVVWVSTRRDHE